ncbi:MAG: T9SS type A sorting domain-containing protein [Cytophagales bacterium]
MKKIYLISLTLILLIVINKGFSQSANFIYNPANPCFGDTTYLKADTTGWNLSQTFFLWKIDNNTFWWGHGSNGANYFGNFFAGNRSIELQVTDSALGISKDTIKNMLVDSICGLSTISGIVYSDQNSNGVKDTTEEGINNALIRISDTVNSYYTYSKNDGTYSLELNTGQYDIELIIPMYYNITHPIAPQYYSVNILNNGTFLPNNDFGVFTDSLIKDLSIHLSNTPLRPGFNGQIEASLINRGSIQDSSNVVLFLDSLTPFLNSFPQEDSIQGNAIYYSFNGIGPNGLRRIKITTKIDSTVQIGTPFNLSSFAFPVTGDANPLDNFDTLSGVVVGSYDPNDKLVFPNDDSTNAFERGTPLTYTIRFQNTGTYFAENVHLVDEIEENLDLNSFQMLAASHDYTYQINENNRKIVWKFDGIMLPAEQDNEPESHGFVKFRIDVDSSLMLGDTVYNSAEIYFDFNFPIITNTIVSTLDSFVTTTSIENANIQDSKLYRLYPNPFKDRISIQGNSAEKIIFELFSIEGEMIFSNQLNESGSIALKNIAPGLYLYKIQSESGKIQRGKLIRQ